MVDDVALVREICVEEATEDHNLVIRDGDTAKLGPLLVLELAIEVDELPSLLLEVIGLSEINSLDSA